MKSIDLPSYPTSGMFNNTDWMEEGDMTLLGMMNQILTLIHEMAQTYSKIYIHLDNIR